MLGALAAACIVTLAATPMVIGWMHRLAAIDQVTARSSHAVPTPRGGGIAVVLGLFAGVLTLVLASGRASAPDLLPLTVGAALFGLIGLAEDVGGITPLRRLALHALAAVTVSTTAVLGAVAADPPPDPALVLLVLVTAPIWITGFVNAFNFMDGINGISAVQATVAAAVLALLGTTHDLTALTAGGAIVAGAALGFAPFNFPRARIFLGDVGSYTLGAAIAVLTVQAVLAGLPPEAVLAPTLLYLADTGWTLLRRIRAKEQWYRPHRTHAYQRLTAAGWPHTRVTGLVGALTVTVSALGLAAFGPPAGRVAADLTICLVLAGYLAAPRWVAADQDHAALGRDGAGRQAGPDEAATPSAAVPSQRRPLEDSRPDDHRPDGAPSEDGRTGDEERRVSRDSSSVSPATGPRDLAGEEPAWHGRGEER